MTRTPNNLSDSEVIERNNVAYSTGCAHYDKGHYSRAKSAFEEALQFWPEDAQAWMAIGNCYEALNKPRLAEQHFRKALEFCNEFEAANIQYNLANSLYDQGLYDAAIEAYLSIPKGHPVWLKARNNLSRAKKKKNRE